MPIIDCHTHAFEYPKHITEAFHLEAAKARGYEMDMTVHWEDYKKHLEAVDYSIVFGAKARYAGIYVPDDYIAEFIRNDPKKLIGFLCIDPNEEGYVEDYERGRDDLGFKGVKLLPMYANFSPCDPRLDEIYSRAERDGLPVLLHMGTTFIQKAPLKYARPAMLEEVALKYPDLKIIVAHMGHPWMEEAIVLVRKQANVYTDISALHYRPWQFYNGLIAAQEYTSTHKLLFGSDFPFTDAAKSMEGLRGINNQLEGTNLPRVSEETIEGLIHRDTLSLLGIEAN